MPVAHRNNFDFLRLTAAIMVWFCHCYALRSIRDPLQSIVSFESFGSLGVAIFFIISGYFITKSYESRSNLRVFLKNRLLRIMPALIAVVLLSVFVLGPAITTLSAAEYFAHPQTWRYLRTLMVFPLQYDLPGVFKSNAQPSVNGSLWTLQHEVRCYLIIAALGVAGILRPRVLAVLFCLCVSYLVYGALQGSTPPATFLTVRWAKLHLAIELATLFLGGAMMYAYRDKIPQNRKLFLGCIALILLSTALPDLWGTILFNLSLTYIVICIGFLPLPLLPKLTSYGDFSYGAYLYAFPVQQLTLHLLGGNNTSTIAFMLVSFVGTAICAFASWHLVERRAIQYKNHA